MDDLISRHAAIDALRGMQTYKLFACDDQLLIDQAGAQTELMMLPPAQPEQRWIPCSERLPEVNTIVLATTADYMYIVEFEVYSNGHMCWNEVIEYRSIEGVIAWMPLPEPYKGEKS